MYPNLNAEQARHNMTNQQVADELGICRNSYESKKKNGKFVVTEVAKLCKMFDSEFNYLFSTVPASKPT